MSRTYRAQEIAKAVESHPFRIERITEESVLSWPVPVKKADYMFLAFFYYPAGGPISDRKIWPPYYRVLADTELLVEIQFTPVEPKDFGINIPGNKPLGKQELSDLGDISMSEYQALVDQLYRLVDQMIPLYLESAATLGNRGRDVVRQFHKLFQKLSPKPLLPFYRALNPDFFSWIDAVL
jgi:hypothetical protein